MAGVRARRCGVGAAGGGDPAGRAAGAGSCAVRATSIVSLASELEGYWRREQTRSDDLRLVAGYLGWKTAPAASTATKELEQFLLDRAMEHDSPTLLFNLATEYLMASKTIRPGVLVLAKMIASARTGASAQISLAHSENINFFGVITVDVEAELAKLDPAGWRPLRPAAAPLDLW